MSNAIGSLTVTDTGDRLEVTGEIDASTVDVLARRLDVAKSGRGDIVLHMAGVQFIDSSGLRVLIEAHQHAEREGRRMVIVEPSSTVTRLFEISGLGRYLHVDS